MVSVQTLRDIYHYKVDLLLNGLRITESFLNSVKEYSELEWQKGRKGGAGPAGGRYFLFENNSVVNAGLWGSQSEKSYLLLEKVSGFSDARPKNLLCTIRNSKTDVVFSTELVPIPEEYNQGKNRNNTLNKQIALIHGTTCLASTIVQKCRYWGENKECAYCGIEFSLKDDATIEIKSHEQLIHAVEEAKKHGLCEHITLTMGTLSKKDRGASKYINVVSKLKEKYPNVPIHVQIEPFPEYEKLKQLKEVGVDTIGVHLEIPNDEIREKVCPGKYETPKFVYETFWRKAVEIFGIGQVSTFIIVGFGEPIKELIEYVDRIIKLGVIPNIMPVRYIVGTGLDYHPISLDSLIKIYDATAKSFLEHKLNPHINKAGCIKCMGCSAIIDAYDYHKRAHHNN